MEEEAARLLLRLWGKDEGVDEGEAEDGCWYMGRMLGRSVVLRVGGGCGWLRWLERASMEGQAAAVKAIFARRDGREPVQGERRKHRRRGAELDE